MYLKISLSLSLSLSIYIYIYIYIVCVYIYNIIEWFYFLLVFLNKAGKTVVATIHQPSSRLFAKFDKLFLLGKGSFLYAGKALEAMTYFSSIGCSPYIAMNPAEFLIDLANGNMNDKSVPSKLENKFIPYSENQPSPIDVHEVRHTHNSGTVYQNAYR